VAHFQVQWTQSAQFDLESIIEYIKTESSIKAKALFFDIKSECQTLQDFPQRKRIVPELQHIGITKYREILYKRWRIVFKIEQKVVFVLLVADMSRNFEDLLLQRLLR
jgi:plasmid stabilization system protein ParE